MNPFSGEMISDPFSGIWPETCTHVPSSGEEQVAAKKTGSRMHVGLLESDSDWRKSEALEVGCDRGVDMRDVDGALPVGPAARGKVKESPAVENMLNWCPKQ